MRSIEPFANYARYFVERAHQPAVLQLHPSFSVLLLVVNIEQKELSRAETHTLRIF
jgi:hypothetical protein